jgi:hypothetical protein
VQLKGMMLMTGSETTLVSGSTSYNIFALIELCGLIFSQLVASIMVATALKDQLCLLYPAAVLLATAWLTWRLWRGQRYLVKQIYKQLGADQKS